MRIDLVADLNALRVSLKGAESLVDASMSRIQARINNVSGPMIGAGNVRGGVGGALRTGGNGLVSSLTGMGTLSTGLGIGAAVSGMALLEQGFARSIRKAKEFQTATLAIAATLGSIGSWQGANGRPLPQNQQAQRNMWEAEKYRQTILTRSAKNILTFDEQLQSFQSGLASGARKGLKPDQIMKLTEQTAIVAKTLGLRGEQISNASRLLMGGGVNVARSTIGRALGISNADISTRSGPQLERFLQSKMKGFDQMQSKFEGSIEGMVSTLEAKIDVLSARAGAKFMKGIAPTLKQIGMLSEPTRDQFDKGAKGQEQFTKSLKTYQQQSKTMDSLVNAAAQGFNGLFNGVKAVVESDSFKTLLDVLIRISSVSKQIMLAMVFKGIASAVMGATGALQRFLAVAGVTTAMGGGLGRGGGMPADLARIALTSGSRGLAGVGATGAGAALGLAGYGPGGFNLRDPNRAGLRASTRATYRSKNDLALERGGAGAVVGSLGYGAANDPSVAGRIGLRGQKAIERAAKAAGRADYLAINRQLPILAQEEKMLMGRIPHMQSMGMSTASEEARLAAIQNERNALITTQQAIPNNYLPAVGRFRAVGANLGARLPMGMMGLMGGQMVKEMGWGNAGTILGSGMQGGSLGYMLGGNRPGFGAGMGAVAGIGSGIASIYQKKSMADLNKQTTPGDIAGMALGGALKWGATGAMIGSMVAPGVGTAIGGGIGAIGGGILEPFIGSMKKAEEQAKASAEALDAMAERFPLGKKMSDLKSDLRGVDKKIAAFQKDIDAGKNQVPGSAEYMSADWARRQVVPLLKQRKGILTKIGETSDKADYQTNNDRRAERIAALQGQIQLYSGSMSQGPSARKKLLGLQKELSMLNVEANIRSIPIAYNDYEAAQKMKGPQREDYTLRKDWEAAAEAWKKTPYAKELQRKYAQFQKNPDNKGIGYEQWVTNRTENIKTGMQKSAMPGIKSQIASKIDLERMDIGYSGQALKALSQGKKTLADYIVYKNQETQKASQYDRGLDDPAFKKYLGAQLREKKTTLREDYESKKIDLATNVLEKQKLGMEKSRLGEDMPIKSARLQIEAQEIQLNSQKTNLDLAKLSGTGLARIGLTGEKLALTGQSLQLQKEGLGLAGQKIDVDIARTLQSSTRLGQDYGLNSAEGALNLQQAMMGQRAAASAPALFYGNMGPVSGAAGAIRNYVESEFAQKFDPAEYEKAYREKLQMEEEQLTINKELADINTKRAALGLDRIEEDYANALIDVTMQLGGLQQSKKQNVIDKKMNDIGIRENVLDQIDQQYAIPEYNLAVSGLKLKQQSDAVSATENAIAQKRLGEDYAMSSMEMGLKERSLGITGDRLGREVGQMGAGLIDIGAMSAPARTKFFSDRGLDKNGGVVTGQGIAIGPAGMSKEALNRLSNLPQIEAQGAYASGSPKASRVGGGVAGTGTLNVSVEAPITNTADIDPATFAKNLKLAMPQFMGEVALKSMGRPQY